MSVADINADRRKGKRGYADAAPSPFAFAYSFADVRSMGGPSRTQCYALEKEGRLTFVRYDGRTKVTGDSLRALLKVKEPA